MSEKDKRRPSGEIEASLQNLGVDDDMSSAMSFPYDDESAEMGDKGKTRRCCSPDVGSSTFRRRCLGAFPSKGGQAQKKKKRRVLRLGLKKMLVPKRLRRFDPSKFTSMGFFHVFSSIKEETWFYFAPPRGSCPACSASRAAPRSITSALLRYATTAMTNAALLN